MKTAPFLCYLAKRFVYGARCVWQTREGTLWLSSVYILRLEILENLKPITSKRESEKKESPDLQNSYLGVQYADK